MKSQFNHIAPGSHTGSPTSAALGVTGNRRPPTTGRRQPPVTGPRRMPTPIALGDPLQRNGVRRLHQSGNAVEFRRGSGRYPGRFAPGFGHRDGHVGWHGSWFGNRDQFRQFDRFR